MHAAQTLLVLLLCLCKSFQRTLSFCAHGTSRTARFVKRVQRYKEKTYAPNVSEIIFQKTSKKPVSLTQINPNFARTPLHASERIRSRGKQNENRKQQQSLQSQNRKQGKLHSDLLPDRLAVNQNCQSPFRLKTINARYVMLP